MGEREEWRGDLFRSDLATVLPHLPAKARIQRPFRDTITIFYAQDGRWVEDRRPVRIRTYGDLPDLSPPTITSFLGHRLTGKIQVKVSAEAGVADEVDVEALHGHAEEFPHLPSHLDVEGATFTPHSVRIARRNHYSVGALLDVDEDEAERHRVTIDLERHLFRLADTDAPVYLGDLGPRLEIKAPGPEEVQQVQDALGVAGLTAHLPYRSLELLFQDLLLSELSVARTSEFPEIEGKLEVTGDRDTDGIGDMLVDWARSLEGARLLLPFPHRIVRMRRYYVCDCASDPREWTVVETMGGKLSTKVKTGERTEGTALLRDTQASHSTDREGRHAPLPQFLAENDLRRLNSFRKLQIQVPFSLENGHAYLVKIDDCEDPAGNRLREVELETVGSLNGDTLDEAVIVADTNEMVSALLESPLGGELEPTTKSKHDFFSACAPSRSEG